jgi:hypothetical protein
MYLTYRYLPNNYGFLYCTIPFVSNILYYGETGPSLPHLHPKQEVLRLTCLGRESNTGLRGRRLAL